jgi:23S rRNA (guanine2445-N2)-methyltransferase / 23S rRNA (guanine2069-N7)-methyltransferase
MSALKSPNFSWFFACPQFVEPLLSEELSNLDAESVKIGHAGVQAVGDLAFGYRALLWSRLASRVTLQLANGYGKTLKELQALVQSIDWDQHLRADGSLKVRFFGRNDEINNTQFGAQWIKDQIADQMRAKYGLRPSVSNNPDLVIVVSVHKGLAEIGIELNRRSLHQRGYLDTDAPKMIRENLAAAILVRAGWAELVKAQPESLALIDPMCGDGSLLIEGALMAYDIAPGLLGESIINNRWLGHDAALWQVLVAQASERKIRGLRRPLAVWGNDSDIGLLRMVKAAWHALKLPDATWTSANLSAMPSQPAQHSGLIVSQLPFAQQPAVSLRPLYQQLGSWMANQPIQYQGALFVDVNAPFALTDLFYSKEYRLLNADVESKLYTFSPIKQKERPTLWISEDLANRLQKNLRKLKGFIKSGVTDAYRVYDADIPEYAIAVDRYADWLHVQEYAPPKSIDEKAAQQRLEQALMTLPEILDVPVKQIVLKQRKPQKGSEQYERQAKTTQSLVVHEHGVKFKVNLNDYLDTGLFLDHRPMRYWMQQHAKDKTVLNLFCYTGAVSVHAAVGGAKRVDSVDMSATYLAWAEDNFALNGFKSEPYKYRFMQANAVEWLQRCKAEYDLIFLDPPTFSNSKRMQDVFDVQRDHVELINQCMRILSSNGTLIFSNNFRKFKLDPSIETAYRVQDYRLPSIPEDFQRDPKIHGCWLITH